ncbi:uncharacterized protein [Ptychodera flava]|uniref:uncharacterized protein isoform X2 n=1 Tax=Ptychodera flava TaxID=63121 RepID=UPI00396AA096
MYARQKTGNMLKWSQSSALLRLLVEVRLSGGRTSSEGIVQIRSYEETKWRLVCGKVEGWNVKRAICKHKGYVTVDKNYLWTVMGNFSSELLSSLAVCDIQCNAEAELIEHCNISWKENGTDCKCQRGRPMGVTCIKLKRTSLTNGPVGCTIGVTVPLVLTSILVIVAIIIRQRRHSTKRQERREDIGAYVNAGITVEDSVYMTLQLNEMNQSTYESLNSAMRDHGRNETSV